MDDGMEYAQVDSPILDIVTDLYNEFVFEYQKLTDDEFDESTFYDQLTEMGTEASFDQEADYENITLRGSLSLDTDDQKEIILTIRQANLVSNTDKKSNPNEVVYVQYDELDTENPPVGYKTHVVLEAEIEVAKELFSHFNGINRSHVAAIEQDEEEPILVTDFTFDVIGEGEVAEVSGQEGIHQMVLSVLKYDDSNASQASILYDESASHIQSMYFNPDDVGFDDNVIMKKQVDEQDEDQFGNLAINNLDQKITSQFQKKIIM